MNNFSKSKTAAGEWEGGLSGLWMTWW